MQIASCNWIWNLARLQLSLETDGDNVRRTLNLLIMLNKLTGNQQWKILENCDSIEKLILMDYNSLLVGCFAGELVEINAIWILEDGGRQFDRRMSVRLMKWRNLKGV